MPAAIQLVGAAFPCLQAVIAGSDKVDTISHDDRMLVLLAMTAVDALIGPHVIVRPFNASVISLKRVQVVPGMITFIPRSHNKDCIIGVTEVYYMLKRQVNLSLPCFIAIPLVKRNQIAISQNLIQLYPAAACRCRVATFYEVNVPVTHGNGGVNNNPVFVAPVLTSISSIQAEEVIAGGDGLIVVV